VTATDALDFRQQHGDPTTWTTAEMETFEHLAETDHLPDFTIHMLLPADPTPDSTTAPAA